MGVIGFRKAKCKDCYKCVRLCEVKAIRIKDEHAQFVASECVECGQCLEACPQNAITFIKDIQWIKSMVKNREKTVVSLAPAYLGVFGDADPNQMAAALHQLGFTYVHETAEAAGYVVQEYMNYHIDNPKLDKRDTERYDLRDTVISLSVSNQPTLSIEFIGSGSTQHTYTESYVGGIYTLTITHNGRVKVTLT